MMKNHHYRWMRGILFAGAMALLLSCGGGGGGSGSAGSLAGIAGSGATDSGSDGPAGAGTGTDGTGGTSGTGTAGGGTDGTSTAGNGSGDGSGVGSGGTGIGSVGGLGSIILNGVRYNTDAATTSLEDAAELQIGMSVRIAGKIDSEFTAATAQQVESAAELRGAVSAVDIGAGSFAVMGTTVTIDNATVWSGANSLAEVTIGSVVQVWGLPSAPGTLRATRVELKPASAEPLVTGVVQNLVPGQQFTLGQLTVRYGSATFSGGIDASTLAEGAIVRVRGSLEPATGVFNATKVQGWYAVPKQNAAAVQLAGVVTNYTGIGDFQVLGTRIDASKTNFPSALVDSIGPGVRVEVDGFMSSGVLIAKKLRIKGGPVDFTLIGPISSYKSASDFRVQGRPVNAGGPTTVFENGTVVDLASLAPNRRVSVVGDAVIDGVLIAKRVTFLMP
jgi:hypothetical protein